MVKPEIKHVFRTAFLNGIGSYSLVTRTNIIQNEVNPLRAPAERPEPDNLLLWWQSLFYSTWGLSFKA